MNFIYRKEQALTPLQCARFIEAFEKDVEHQQEGVISKDGLKYLFACPLQPQHPCHR